MKLSGLTFTIGMCWAGVASAGGLLLPGSGAISTARAGASVASVDDGESIAINPAGLAKSHGTQIQIGIAAIDFIESFQRNGSYDPIAEEATSYAGMRYPVMNNEPKPPLGIGPYQPVPAIAVVTDFGGKVPGLHAAFGLYAPNAYPFRDYNSVNGHPYFVKQSNGGYAFPSAFDAPPPPTRYDIVHEEAAVILPSVAVAYRVLPNLDVGGRYSIGIADLSSTVGLWGLPANYEEWIKQDGIFTIKAKDTLVQAFSLGTAFRPTDNIEIGAQYTSTIDIHAKGDAYTFNGPNVTIGGAAIEVDPAADPRCQKGGTQATLKACVDVEIPMTAQVGARYKFLDDKGAEKGDVEVDLDWEHWGASCDYTKDPKCLNPSDYHVLVDAQVAEVAMPTNSLPLQSALIGHGFKDTYGARVGGSWSFPVDGASLIARGGVGYDSAAAKSGWERLDVDGAARTMISAGASYKMTHLKIDAGVGVILEGTRSTSRDCNPTAMQGQMGCSGTGANAPIPGYRTPSDTLPDRTGPDPENPLIPQGSQTENPVNQGTFSSHYLMFMLGASYQF